MIHRFHVRNYLSIRDGVDLDFRVPGTTPDHPRFRSGAAASGLRLPTTVVLIGPNGSGKTTVLRAIIATRSFMAWSFGYRPGYRPGEWIVEFLAFKSRESYRQPTRVEMEFDAEWPPFESGRGTLFRYTLEVLRNDDNDIRAARVGYEALHAFPRGRPRRVFERRGEEPVHVARGLGLRPGDDRLASVPPTASVISTLGNLGVASFAAMARDFESVETNVAGAERWHLSDDLAIQTYQDVPELTQNVSGMLPRFDLGIQNMKVRELPSGPALEFDHHGLDSPVPLIGESAGTRHLVRTFPLLQSALDNGSLAVMDDFDVEFHADLAVEVLRWFQSAERNPRGAQLICSTHNLSLLDDLEKEEVFIAEKGRDGATRAYGVRQIAGVRRTENLQKLYRSGALGGLPSLG